MFMVWHTQTCATAVKVSIHHMKNSLKSIYMCNLNGCVETILLIFYLMESLGIYLVNGIYKELWLIKYGAVLVFTSI